MATLQVRLQDLATRIATQCKTILTLVNGNAADLSALTFGPKTNLVASLNALKAELDGIAGAAGATINDASSASTTQTYSITKIRDLVAASISALTSGAPTALDTLDELAAALGDDANFAATITTALGNRLRFDTAQSLTTAQKAQGNANLGSAALADTGNLDTDFVATFTAGLA